MTNLSARGITVAYGSVRVLEELTFEASRGEWLCLIGPNGAGKSSALRAIAGLIPHSGEVRVGKVSLESMSRREIARVLAFVPQNPLLPEGMSVEQYVLLGRTPFISYLGTEGSSDVQVVTDVLVQLELDGLATRPLGSLSGGEQQRTILARALAQRAPILVLDEPTTSLDVGKQQTVLELVDSLRASDGLTVISAMHDLTLAGHFADTLLLLSGGLIAGFGRPRAVLTESAIERHYGASVRVVEDAHGVSVIPTRPRASRGIAEGA